MKSLDSFIVRFATALAVTAAVSFGLYKAWQYCPIISQEDHLLEWMQVILLALASILHFREAARIRASPTASEKSLLLRSGLGLLALSFLIRELEIDHWLHEMNGERFQFYIRLVLFFIWMIYTFFFIKSIPYLWRKKFKLIARPSLQFTFFGCVLYLASAPYDKKLFNISEDMSQFIEELLQLFACGVILIGALQARKSNNHKNV